MKIAFLVFGVFFLSACAGVPARNDCPIMSLGTPYVVSFEYGRADLSKSGADELNGVARHAAGANAKVCVAAVTRQSGVPQDQLALSVKRMKAVGDVFYQQGVDLKNLYLISTPANESNGLSAPVSARDVTHKVLVYVGF